MRISDWSSDVCSSDLATSEVAFARPLAAALLHRPDLGAQFLDQAAGALGIGPERVGTGVQPGRDDAHRRMLMRTVTSRRSPASAPGGRGGRRPRDRKSTRPKTSHKYATSMPYMT